MRQTVARRREIVKILRAYPDVETVSSPPCGNISVMRGEILAKWARTAAAWERREKFDRLIGFVRAPCEPKVCIVYGLRRTGKTTMLMQAVNQLSPEQRSFELYEVKHSAQPDDRQARHLRDAEKIAAVEARHGTVVSRTVLYRGKSFEAPDGVAWRNVEDYLESLR